MTETKRRANSQVVGLVFGPNLQDLPELREQYRLILPDMFRTKLIRAATEIPAEVIDSMDIRTDSRLGEVATLQLLNHGLT